MMLAVLLLVAVTVMTIDLSDGRDGPVTRVRHGAVTVFAPVQQVVATAVRPLTAAVRWVDDQRGLHDELARTRARAARLEAAAVERDDLRGENSELRRLLGMRERVGAGTVGARVLGTVPGDPGSSVMIDAGTDDGLAPGMTVLDDHGVVGRLVTVTARHARVELVTSATARYAVRVVAGQHLGRLRGRGDGALQLELDDPHATVPAGAVVVTRAFQGSAVPDGLPIGTVAPQDGADRYRLVNPAMDRGALDLVQVVTAPAQPEQLPSADVPTATPLPPPPRPGER
jgi:rod shape-determining protein MreC